MRNENERSTTWILPLFFFFSLKHLFLPLASADQTLNVLLLQTSVCYHCLDPSLMLKPFRREEQWPLLWYHQAKNSTLPRMNTVLILLPPPLAGSPPCWTVPVEGGSAHRVLLRLIAESRSVCVCVSDRHSLCNVMWSFIWNKSSLVKDYIFLTISMQNSQIPVLYSFNRFFHNF